jgi:hypothetical protein
MKTTHLSFIIGMALFPMMFSCTNAPAPAQTAAETELAAPYTADGDQVVIPTFEIDVSSSEAAAKTLGNQKETIIVAAYFSGIPSDEKDMDEIGMLPVLNKEIELSGGQRVARFEGLKFPRTIYEKLKDKDIELLINVFSGRKSSEDNLLDCGLLQITASQLKDKRFTLGCKLIEEPAESVAGPIACYALPEAGSAPDAMPSLLVECSERGDMSFAGQPVADFAALKTVLSAALADWKKTGAPALPGISVSGCMMGASGEIRTLYEELTAEMGKQ